MKNTPIYRKVPASNGSLWLKQAFALFVTAKGTWIGIIAFIFFLLVIPGVNNLVAILMPVAIGGLMIGCQQLSSKKTLKFDHLFAGIKKDGKQLLVLSAVYAIGSFLIMLLTLFFMSQLGLDYQDIIPENFEKMSPEQIIEWSNQLDHAKILPILAIGLLISLALMIPIFMAFWFAPALVVFQKRGAIEALTISFSACTANTIPFLIYGLVAMGYLFLFFFFLSLLMMIVPIIAVPIMIFAYLAFFAISLTSIYTSYIDIFSQPNDNDDTNLNEDYEQDNDQDNDSSMLA